MKTFKRSERGMTLIELMIVLSLIGIMMGIAIPSFINYQLTSKRAEAFNNLAALAKTQKTFYAEKGEFYGHAAEPMGDASLSPDTEKKDSQRVVDAFSGLGWAPEGMLFYSYDSVTPGSPGASCELCTQGCFTASAYGDLDGNDSTSVMLYAQPDLEGNSCESWLTNDRPYDEGGELQFNQVVRVVAADRF